MFKSLWNIEMMMSYTLQSISGTYLSKSHRTHNNRKEHSEDITTSRAIVIGGTGASYLNGMRYQLATVPTTQQHNNTTTRM